VLGDRASTGGPRPPSRATRSPTSWSSATSKPSAATSG
jgi:hypothetical protein